MRRQFGPSRRPAALPRVIRLQDVSFRYRAGKAPALSGITSHIHPGELVGLLGRSGSGRSTLAATLNGTIPHLVRGDLQGQVRIAGQDIRSEEHTSELQSP